MPLNPFLGKKFLSKILKIEQKFFQTALSKKTGLEWRNIGFFAKFCLFG